MKERQKLISDAIENLYKAVNPEDPFFVIDEMKRMRESIYRCIRKLEEHHDRLGEIHREQEKNVLFAERYSGNAQSSLCK